MKQYELLYIVPGQYSEAEVEGVRKNVAALIEKIDARIIRHDNLGKIKLAYPINKARHGTYILVYFEAENGNIASLDRELRMSNEVLRHQLLVAPKGAVERRYEITSYVPPLSEEARRESPASFSPVPPKPLAPPPPAVIKEENTLSVEELDKKLDELLEDDMTKSL